MLAVVYRNWPILIIILCSSDWTYSESYSILTAWHSEVSKVHCHNSKIPWFYCSLSYSPAGLTFLRFIPVLLVYAFVFEVVPFYKDFYQDFYQNFVYSISLNIAILLNQRNFTDLFLIYSKLTFYECTNFRRKQSYDIWPAVTLVWILVPVLHILVQALENF